MIFSELLEKVYSCFEDTAEIVAYNHVHVDEEFELSDTQTQVLTESKILKGCGKDIYMSLTNSHKYFNAVWRMCVRRSYLDEIGVTFVEGIFYEDVMYTLTCYLNAKYMIYIDEQLYAYRNRQGAITNSRKFAKGVDSYISILAQLLDYLDEEKYDSEIEACILNNIGRELIEDMSSKLLSLKGYQPIWKENEPPYWLSCAMNIHARQEAFNNRYYLKGFERLIRTASGTIVYGAGGIGRMLGQYFEKENMLSYINSYCVTEKKEELQIEGIEVRDIEYIRNFDKDVLIIIAANATASEMEKKIRDYGYYNYVVIDRLLENIIYNALNG